MRFILAGIVGGNTIVEIQPSDDAMTREDILRQSIKWIVYSLLLINWGYYIFEDWSVAQHTLSPGDSLLKWMNSYATTLDEMAWFTMLLLFEIETYWLSDDKLSFSKRLAFVSVRIACYAFLAHTMFAYWISYLDIVSAFTLPAGTAICDVLAQDYSFTRNLAYTDITATNCASLSSGGELFQIRGEPVITDASGLTEIRHLAIIDILDVTTWLAVVLVIEFVVVMQERGISDGPVIVYSNRLTTALYSILVFNAGYWIWKGHYVYGWDQLLWIGGFAAIGMNLSDWRDEIQDAGVPA